MNKPKPKAISVLSGGLDSTVATSYFKDKYDIHALTFDYGQLSVQMEIHSAKEICKRFDIEHTILKLPWLAKISRSALTSHSQDIPQLKTEELDDKSICDETARKVWVPGRNIVFTSIATSFAEAEGAECIIMGWDREEAATFPDNSKEFLEAFNRILDIGSLDEIKIEAPLIKLDKTEIVKLGLKVNAPLNLSYSCYLGEKEHCGTCESCMRRKRAFENSEIEDQTRYKVG